MLWWSIAGLPVKARPITSVCWLSIRLAIRSTTVVLPRTSAYQAGSVWRGRYGLPPEKWSSLRYGFEPAGGREDGKEAAHGRRDRQQAAAGRRADGTGPTGSGGGPGDRGERGHLLPLAGGVRRAEGRPGQAPEGARG